MKRRTRLLDLFCGAGGCSVGYHRAGYEEVVGVDIEPHNDYPFELIVADAMTFSLDGFDAVHASPPCPRFSAITPDPGKHPDLLTPTIARLRAWGGPWVVENVPGAPVPNGVLLCGQALGLRGIRRHRMFGSDLFLMSPGCGCSNEPVYGIYGDHGDLNGPPPSRNGQKAKNAAHARQLMGIDWMVSGPRNGWDDLADAIPPAYTEFIGSQLIEQLELAA